MRLVSGYCDRRSASVDSLQRFMDRHSDMNADLGGIERLTEPPGTGFATRRPFSLYKNRLLPLSRDDVVAALTGAARDRDGPSRVLKVSRYSFDDFVFVEHLLFL